MQFIPRKLYFELIDHLAQPEISLILGPRQAGKTTIMKKITEELRRQGRPVIYFDLDLIEDRQFFPTQHTLIEKIQKTVGQRKDLVVFIDEIQRLKNSGLFLKGLYDLQTNYKFIVSGSGSLELKSNIIEPMTGRKSLFYCYPLSFSEVAAYRLGVKFAEVEQRLSLNPFERTRIVDEYLNFGGYPRVALASTYQEKIEILREIFTSYLEKDIRLILGVEKEEAFAALVRILANQVGNLVNRQELSSTLGISEKSVKKYLFFLEKTFVVSLVKPFFSNVRREIRKSPKIYFLDLGLLRLAKRLTTSQILPTSGEIFENACFLRLKELFLANPPRFWRSTAGAEVDFVVDDPKTGQVVTIEVKSKGRGKTLGKSLISFLLKYNPKKTFIYTQDQSKNFKRGKTEINYISYHKLLRF